MQLAKLIDPKIYERLCREIHSSKVRSAYLLTGYDTLRVKSMAMAFAKAVNCEQISPALDCDCAVCTRIESHQHPDVRWYGLDEDANSIKIQEVRDFRNWLHLKPFEARTKVFIFNGADRLTGDAQNALLKSLEEPPPDNVILLLVPQSGNLFDTTVSRCVEVKIPPAGTERVMDILIEEGIPAKQAALIARMSDGSLTKAYESNDSGWVQQRSEWAAQIFSNPGRFLEQFHSMDRKKVAAVFEFILECIRDLMAFSAAQSKEVLIYSEHSGSMERLADGSSFEALYELFHGIRMCQKSLDENANVKLTLTQAQILWENFLNVQ